MSPSRRASIPPFRLSCVLIATLIVVAFAADPPTETKLLAPDGVANDGFGDSAAVSGDLIAVGAPFRNSGEDKSGAIYLYRHDGQAWTFEERVSAADPDENAWLGWSVAASGDTVVAGAPYDDGTGAA
ncbi:MAG: FG-GAP repeat protein, partial [Planctomycetota bacterium]